MQRPSSVQLWQIPAGSRTPKDAVPEDTLFLGEPLPEKEPLPEEAQEASYFAVDARMDNFSARSMINYTSV